ncbi:MAG TPA: hypothetical protein DCS93_17115 [Microscillaceae bacterium]|nr:hypothetical protein [Microscillaceae bacterium]
MIEKVSNITSVNYELFGPLLLNNISEKQPQDLFQGAVPLQFNYNSNWAVMHSCASCKRWTGFGWVTGHSKPTYPISYHTQMGYVCTKYYAHTLLDIMLQLLDHTRKETQGTLESIVFRDFYNKDFPITSSIEPIYYECSHCTTEYLGLFRNGHPMSPEKDLINGRIGTIFLDQIVQIKGNIKFAHLVAKHRL